MFSSKSISVSKWLWQWAQMFSNGCDRRHKCFQMVVTFRHEKTSHARSPRFYLQPTAYIQYVPRAESRDSAFCYCWPWRTRLHLFRRYFKPHREKKPWQTDEVQIKASGSNARSLRRMKRLKEVERSRQQKKQRRRRTAWTTRRRAMKLDGN